MVKKKAQKKDYTPAMVDYSFAQERLLEETDEHIRLFYDAFESAEGSLNRLNRLGYLRGAIDRGISIEEGISTSYLAFPGLREEVQARWAAFNALREAEDSDTGK